MILEQIETEAAASVVMQTMALSILHRRRHRAHEDGNAAKVEEITKSIKFLESVHQTARDIYRLEAQAKFDRRALDLLREIESQPFYEVRAITPKPEFSAILSFGLAELSHQIGYRKFYRITSLGKQELSCQKPRSKDTGLVSD